MDASRPIRQIPSDLCRRLEYFFTDLDDTLTTAGLIPPEAFRAVWDLHRAGVAVVVVTGRPAGWCDHIARMWPVLAVIGENGAFYFAYDRPARRMNRRYLISEEDRRRGRERLEAVRRRVLAEVPGCAISADQAYRITDLAVDFREDVPPLGDEAIDRICRIVHEEGAVCKVSSIHVNCWYGDFDKVRGVRTLVEDRIGGSFEEIRGRVAFIGDSPNDEPLFAALEHSIGVANIRPFLDRIRSRPAFVTDREAGEGFQEAAGIILEKRARAAPGRREA